PRRAARAGGVVDDAAPHRYGRLLRLGAEAAAVTVPLTGCRHPPHIVRATAAIPVPMVARNLRDAGAMHDKILIVDFGSQVTQLIARRVREEKVYCEIVPYQAAAAAFARMRPKGVILSGGPASVLAEGAPLAPL